MEEKGKQKTIFPHILGVHGSVAQRLAGKRAAEFYSVTSGGVIHGTE